MHASMHHFPKGNIGKCSRRVHGRLTFLRQNYTLNPNKTNLCDIYTHFLSVHPVATMHYDTNAFQNFYF